MACQVANQFEMALLCCRLLLSVITSIITIGAISISEMMMLNHSLQELYIWENNVGDDGTSAIAKALNNCKINKLQMDECGITFTGVESIAAALSLSHSVTDLCLYRNPITIEGGLLIVKTAVHHSVCQRVEIDDECKNEEIEKMMKILKRRRKQKVQV